MMLLNLEKNDYLLTTSTKVTSHTLVNIHICTTIRSATDYKLCRLQNVLPLHRLNEFELSFLR